MGIFDLFKKISLRGDNKNIVDKLVSKKDVSISINVGFNDGQYNQEGKRKYKGKSENGSYSYESINTKGQRIEGWTSESEEKYNRRIILEKIERESEELTINFEGQEYNREELKNLYDEISKTFDPPDYGLESRLPDIINDDELSKDELDFLKKMKIEQDAKKWKSRLRSKRRNGQLEQYQIDALNKLGMIWNPKGRDSSNDEWERNYILYRKFGLCFEIKNWVEEQRALFTDNNIPNENLLRLKAVKFPFEILQNESYKLKTRSGCWELREKLDKKIRRFQLKEQKKLNVYEKEKSQNLSKKEIEERKKSNKEVNSFYNRKYSYCDVLSINKLDKEEAFKELAKLDEGHSYVDNRLREFLDNESETFKKNKRRTPHYVKQFYNDINENKLSDDEIYNQLSKFNINGIDSEIRKLACQYMLKRSQFKSLKTSRFKEIDYLISINKKEKNKTELLYLKDFINKYPMLKELYEEKLLNVILKLK